MMRILHLSSLYPPHIVGGAERSVSMLAETQVAEGHQVAAACISPHGWSRETRNGVEVFRMPHENDFWLEDWRDHTPRRREIAKLKQQVNFRIGRHFDRVIRAFRPDILNSHSLVDISTIVWGIARRHGVPIVHTLRDYDLVCAASSMYRETGPCAHRHLKCRMLTFRKQFDQRHVAAVTGVGREILDRHVDLGFFGHVSPAQRQVIWSIADVVGAASRSDAPGGTDQPLTFGYLGRISPEKGVDVLMRALRGLPATGWALKVAGAPVDEATTRSAEGLPVEFVGFVEPGSFLGSIDVLVVPSVWPEPLPRTVLEAYRVGVPVIGSRTGGIAELVDDPQWLFTPGDDQALANLMRDVIIEGRAALPTADRYSHIVARTSREAVSGAFQAIYEGVVASNCRDAGIAA